MFHKGTFMRKDVKKLDGTLDMMHRKGWQQTILIVLMRASFGTTIWTMIPLGRRQSSNRSGES